MEWASLQQEELTQDWGLARRQAELNKIAPLEQTMFGVDVTHVQPFEGGSGGSGRLNTHPR